MTGLSDPERWSLEAVPEGQRLSLLREVYGPSLNIDIVPLTSKPIFELELLPLGGIVVMHCRHSAHRVARTDVSRENDDLVLGWSACPGRGRLTQRGREVKDGAAVLFSCADRFASDMYSEFHVVNVRLRRELIASILPRAEDALMRPIPPDHPPFRLLSAYLDIIRREQRPESPECAAAIAAHICDLVALSAGAIRDVEALAANSGVRAARLATIKRWVLTRLHEFGLSVADAAAAERVSARYVQMLFEAEGTTFSAFLLKARLAQVHRQLLSPLWARAPISALAFNSGFGDLSYFNRAFRAAYFETPSDVRHGGALRGHRGRR